MQGHCGTAAVSVTFSKTISVAPGEGYVVGFFGRNQPSRGVGYGTGDAANRIPILLDGIGLLAPADHASCSLDCVDPSREWIAFESSFNAGEASSITTGLRIVASGTADVCLSADDVHLISSRCRNPACGPGVRRAGRPGAAPARAAPHGLTVVGGRGRRVSYAHFTHHPRGAAVT